MTPTRAPGADEAGPPISPGPEVATPVRPPRFASFDGLRAIAAMMVLVFHAAASSGFTFHHAAGLGLGTLTGRLNCGVAVFFLISGFLLYRPFVVARLASAEAPKAGSFWLRRILRIVPAYWVALFVATELLHYPGARWTGGWAAILTHYFFLQVYFPTQNFLGLFVAWTLCVEVSFYLFLPLYSLLVGRVVRRGKCSPLAVEMVGVAVLIALSVVWQLLDDTKHLGMSLQYEGLAAVWLPTFLELFGFGMALAILSAWFHHHGIEPAVFARRAFPWVCWALAAAAYLAMCNLGFNPGAVFQPLSPSMAALEALEGIFALFLLLPAVFGPPRRGLIRKFLQCWPMAALGVISYGIYLWNSTWCSEILQWMPRARFDSWHGLLLFTAMVSVLTIAVATASYFIVERPALRLKQRFTLFRLRSTQT